MELIVTLRKANNDGTLIASFDKKLRDYLFLEQGDTIILKVREIKSEEGKRKYISYN